MKFTKDDLIKLHTTLCAQGCWLMQKKNDDYTAGGTPFANFNYSEVFGVQREIGLLIRVMDKQMRILSFLRKGVLKVKDESVEDSIVDCINYMVLLAGMIEERRLSKEDTHE